MKIAIVCFNLDWQTGGPRVIFSSAQALRKLGHAVVIYAPEFDGTAFPGLWDRLDIRVVPPRAPFLWRYASPSLWHRVRQKISQARLHRDTARRMATAMDGDFDVVNYHDFAYEVAPFYRRRNPLARAVWTAHDPPFMYLPKQNLLYDLLSRIFNWLEDRRARRVFRSLDAAVVLNARNKRWVEDHGIKGFIVRCGVDFRKFAAPVKRRQASDKSVTLLGVGALNPSRRYEDIIAAASLLRKEGYDARVILICKDIWNVRDYRTEILRLTNELAMEPYVGFRFDGVTDEEMSRIQRESDVFVASTHVPPPRNGYPWGLALVEAMAAGLPAVIANSNDIREALMDGEEALFVSPMSPEEIARKVEALLRDPNFYSAVASRGQRWVKENLAWERYAEGLLAVFRDA